jgi:hypothetical protein
MIAMKLGVVMPEGTVDVIIGPKVQVEWERHYSMGIAAAFGEDMRMEYVYYLAWLAMRHVRKTSSTFDEWLDEVIDVEMDDDESAAPLAVTP